MSSKFIKLTATNGVKLNLRADTITAFAESTEGKVTVSTTDGAEYGVQESTRSIRGYLAKAEGTADTED